MGAAIIVCKQEIIASYVRQIMFIVCACMCVHVLVCACSYVHQITLKVLIADNVGSGCKTYRVDQLHCNPPGWVYIAVSSPTVQYCHAVSCLYMWNVNTFPTHISCITCWVHTGLHSLERKFPSPRRKQRYHLL